jgi:peptidoglycan-associated lipoprotein
MKRMNLIYPLAFALAITLAATGCKHQPVKMTNLPAPPNPAVVDVPSQPTIPPGATITPEQPPISNPNLNPNPNPPGGLGTPTTPLDLFEGMIQDRATLANYTVHFDFDSAVVKKSEHANLEAVNAALANDAALKLLIEGNCDERGTEEYNRSLGERRALALREALARLNLDPQRVRTESFGKDKPVDPGHDEAAWAKNRRGDFVLLHPNPNAVPGAPKP